MKRRNQLSRPQRVTATQAIAHRMIQLMEWRSARCISSYLPVGSEVDPWPLIRTAWEEGKTVAVPFYDTTRQGYRLARIEDPPQLSQGPHGVLEPAPDTREPIQATAIDCALIPGVAFDVAGGRLGHGGGHFDRLLRSLVHAKRVGLAYEAQITTHPLPIGTRDVPMDVVVTERRTIRPSKREARNRWGGACGDGGEPKGSGVVSLSGPRRNSLSAGRGCARAQQSFEWGQKRSERSRAPGGGVGQGPQTPPV
ncbi:MAG: 5-formyltetrahydrofolate cyclo-ligase [Elusimicrobia bacterium]|nr:5-formyltetrahydrofolate cyclo-ligase [Elusimicrobiota bacterium]